MTVKRRPGSHAPDDGFLGPFGAETVWDPIERRRVLPVATAHAGPILRRWEKVAASGKSVLITGETGTGKEVLADLLVARGPRSWNTAKGFPKVNCAGIDSTLLRSELFGHKKGAFTGALKDRRGILVSADKRTVLLDEISEAASQDQAAILRFMQTGEVRPVGADTSRKNLDVRVIAATNEDPNDSRKLRQDLRWRFHYEINVPPLRQRARDIVRLLARLLTHGGTFSGISLSFLWGLMIHPWPGNIRDLERFCRNVSELSDDAPSENADSIGCVLDWRHAPFLERYGFDPLALKANATRFPLDCLSIYARCYGHRLEEDVPDRALLVNSLKLLFALTMDEIPVLQNMSIHPTQIPLEQLGSESLNSSATYDLSVVASLLACALTGRKPPYLRRKPLLGLSLIDALSKLREWELDFYERYAKQNPSTRDDEGEIFPLYRPTWDQGADPPADQNASTRDDEVNIFPRDLPPEGVRADHPLPYLRRTRTGYDDEKLPYLYEWIARQRDSLQKFDPVPPPPSIARLEELLAQVPEKNDREILRLYSRGCSVRGIAKKTGIPRATVSEHKNALMRDMPAELSELLSLLRKRETL